MKSCICFKEGDGGGGSFSTISFQLMIVDSLLLHLFALVAT